MTPCGCPPETFWTLLHDAAHWEFELFLILVFDGILFGLGGLVLNFYGINWKTLKEHWQHHMERDKREAR